MTAPLSEAASDFSLDGEAQTFGSTVRNYVAKVRGGDLGSLPAMLAIAVLITVFGLARPDTFLSERNFANFLGQASSIIVIAMAVTFVLLLGEIDLAAGYTAGVAAAVLALRLRDGWPLIPAILLAAAAAIALGLLTGFLVARLGIPSFVVTLANFLSFQGILLLLVKQGGSVRFDNPIITNLVGGYMSVVLSWVFAAVAIALYTLFSLLKLRSSNHRPPSVIFAQIAAVAVGTLLLTAIMVRNRNPEGVAEQRGMPYVVPAILVILIVLSFVLGRTRYGRHLYAVGGNAEAARRAGINVTRIRLSAFTFCALVAAIGGAFLASVVDSVDSNTGGNDTLLLAVGAAVIGGTSLFGGKGRMVNAVMGGLVLALIPNGLGLIGKATIFGTEIDFGSSGIKFICSGLALLLAASVDALSRKRAL
jgi:D-xylose transport system permease protein